MGNRETLRETFDSAAEKYDAARPAYPDELFDDLVSLARLERGDRLLEIGCATGKATRPLLDRGFSVVCVEMGARLGALARATLAGSPFEIHVQPFETFEAPPATFDLVFAATAWHWVDPALKYEKAHRLLRPGGHLAFWAAQHAFPAGFDPFFVDIQDVYDEIGESYPAEEWPPPPPDEVHDDVPEIEASGLFEEVAVRRYVWETWYTADEYVALLDTFSGHISMEAWKRERLYGAVRTRIAARDDPRLRRHWLAILHVARRKEQQS